MSVGEAPTPAVKRGNLEMRSRSSSSAIRSPSGNDFRPEARGNVRLRHGAIVRARRPPSDRRAHTARSIDRRGAGVTGATAQAAPASVPENRPRLGAAAAPPEQPGQVLSRAKRKPAGPKADGLIAYRTRTAFTAGRECGGRTSGAAGAPGGSAGPV